MAIVDLDFTPPIEEDLVSLHIYESAVKEGPFVEIEEVTAIGSYPDYISHYTTILAVDGNAWFTIRWENDKGAMTPFSTAVQGGVETFPSKIVDRVLQRDRSLDEGVVLQEAEAVISEVLNVDDPYSVSEGDVTYRQLSGITYLTLARSYIARIVRAAESGSYTAGLISLKGPSDVSKSLANIDRLIDMANGLLGINTSLVMQMKDIELASGSVVSFDISRLIIEVE